MAIRPSPAPDITRLIDELSSTDAVKRESASARLAIIGRAAVPKLVVLARQIDADVPARAAALRALSATGGATIVALAADMLKSEFDELAIEAVELCRTLLDGSEPDATKAFEYLTGLALDATGGVERRLAAIAALERMPDSLMAPVYDTLAHDNAHRIVARVIRKHAGLTSTFEDLVQRELPESPDIVLKVLTADAEHTRLAVLRQAVEIVRTRERSQSKGGAAEAWRHVRASLHQSLGERGSRLALYDLRDALDAAHGQMPLGFLIAASAIGDPACLAPLARAWVAAEAEDRRWRDQLATAFSAIVKRERLTRQHPVMRRILTEWPAAGVLVASAPRTRRRTAKA